MRNHWAIRTGVAHLAAWTALTCGIGAGLAKAGEIAYTLPRAVPADVFLCVAGRSDAESKFADQYWGEVFQAFHESGIIEDVVGAVTGLMGEAERGQFDHYHELVHRLASGVNWGDLAAKEMVYAQRMSKVHSDNGNLSMGPPDLLWLFRGEGDGVAKNETGLKAIFQAIHEEIAKIAPQGALTLETSKVEGADATLLRVSDVNPPMALVLARKDDVILVAFGENILKESLALLANKGKNSLAETARYKEAFRPLQPAEREMVFFDMQAMLAPMKDLAEKAAAMQKTSSEDRVSNVEMPAETQDLYDQAHDAYEAKNYDKAIELCQRAHDLSPGNSVVQYNLACFHALKGNKLEALKWLKSAVEAGYHAPNQIRANEDFATIRDDAKFQEILALAGKHAEREAVVGWFEVANRGLNAVGIVDYIASTGYTEGHSIHEDTRLVLVKDAAQRPIYEVFGKRKPLTGYERFIPKDATAFSMEAGVDMSQFVRFVRESVQAYGPDGEAALKQFDQMQKGAGFDLQRDLLDWLDGGMISVTMGEGMASSSVLLVKVTDEAKAKEKVGQALTAVTSMVQQLASQQPMLGMLSMQQSPETFEGLENFHRLTIAAAPGQPLVWGAADGYLIFGTSADGVHKVLETTKGKLDNITKNERVMSEAIIPKGPFCSMTYTDQRKIGSQMADALAGMSMGLGMAAMAVPDPEGQKLVGKLVAVIGKLGPVLRKVDFYRSTASACTFDGKEWRTHGVTNYQPPSERSASAKPQ